jgi:hypothetical protein
MYLFMYCMNIYAFHMKRLRFFLPCLWRTNFQFLVRDTAPIMNVFCIALEIANFLSVLCSLILDIIVQSRCTDFYHFFFFFACFLCSDFSTSCLQRPSDYFVYLICPSLLSPTKLFTIWLLHIFIKGFWILSLWSKLSWVRNLCT